MWPAANCKMVFKGKPLSCQLFCHENVVCLLPLLHTFKCIPVYVIMEAIVCRAATIQLPHDIICIRIFASRMDMYRNIFLTT